MPSGQVIVVADGQYGSSGKGAVCGHLATPETIGVRVGGSQAGHTIVDSEGTPWPLRHVPVTAVTSDAPLIIAAGSEIDVDVLMAEVRALDAAGYHVSRRLYVDETATVIEPRHQEAEAGLNERSGSTGKGVGAARADRALRRAELYGRREFSISNVSVLVRSLLATGSPVIIEGTQGYALGTHAGHYPFCTSIDCRAIDFLAQAGLSPWDRVISEVQVVLACRYYPIRIAGNSGPMRNETTWADLGLPEEYTTVTKKVRRVGKWDGALVRNAVVANGPGDHLSLALTMLDQRWPELAGVTDLAHVPNEVMSWVRDVEIECGARVGMLGTGPSTAVMLRDYSY